EVFSDMMDSMKFYSYNLMKMRMPISVLSIIVSILYFSIVPLLLGKTLGMHLFHMNFESENKILFSNYFIRSIFLTGSISFLISSIILYKLDYSSFYNVYLIISALNIGYNLANLIMIIARKNHRGLNDLFGGVSVVWRNLC
ncbi:MAG: RDD family protein, partial [Acholeplasmatales bacterium]|nr:RDD family protein [Acholeplasmatales bacterium]